MNWILLILLISAVNKDMINSEQRLHEMEVTAAVDTAYAYATPPSVPGEYLKTEEYTSQISTYLIRIENPVMAVKLTQKYDTGLLYAVLSIDAKNEHWQGMLRCKPGSRVYTGKVNWGNRTELLSVDLGKFTSLDEASDPGIVLFRNKEYSGKINREWHNSYKR
ncbi:MAG: hypothetical protein JNL57_06630 [Bacteroidetes bacterium]|nr:hypothetical protein [Bacteroidota bacterium]